MACLTKNNEQERMYNSFYCTQVYNIEINLYGEAQCCQNNETQPMYINHKYTFQ